MQLEAPMPLSTRELMVLSHCGKSALTRLLPRSGKRHNLLELLEPGRQPRVDVPGPHVGCKLFGDVVEDGDTA